MANERSRVAGVETKRCAAAWRVAVLSLICIGHGYAQQFSYEEYSVNQGLKNAAINTITQDQEGFLWVGTMSGLFRGDGLEFSEYGESDGLPSGTIQAVLTDRQGRLWVATRYGVAVKHGSMFRALDANRKLEIYGRSALAVGKAGEVYVATKQGLLVCREGPEPKERRLEKVSGEATDGVYVDRAGGVWTSEARKLVRRRGDRVEVYGEAQGAPASRWDAFLEDRQGRLWVRSSEHLIYRRPGARHFETSDNNLPASGYFGALFADHNGQLLVPTDSGLAYQGKHGWARIGVVQGLPSDTVSCAFQDREDSLWLGLWGFGLVRILGYGVVHSWTPASGLASATVGAIHRDRSGRMWAGTDAGLSRMEKDGLGWKTWGKLKGQTGEKIRAITQTADGALWAGSFPGGVARLDPVREQAKRFGRQSGTGFDRVNGMLVDEQDRVWVASVEGLFRSAAHPGPGAQFERLTPPGAQPNEAYFRMAAGKGGTIWVASSGGLLQWKAGRWRRIGKREGILSEGLTHVVEMPDGGVWVAYRDPLGISRLSLDANGGVMRAVHYQSELASRTILLLRTDNLGRLWVGGDDGLDVYDGKRWARFTQANGLAGNSCAVDAFYADPDGPVWIGTARGLTQVMDPSVALYPVRAPLRTVLTRIDFGGRRLDGAPLAGRSVDFEDRTLSVSMGVLTFRDRKPIRFRYRLLGSHESWIETSEREARYARLAPGEYTFEATGYLPGVQTPGPVARFSFTVLPPFWQTWWFRALGAMALAGVIRPFGCGE